MVCLGFREGDHGRLSILLRFRIKEAKYHRPEETMSHMTLYVKGAKVLGHECLVGKARLANCSNHDVLFPLPIPSVVPHGNGC